MGKAQHFGGFRHRYRGDQKPKHTAKAENPEWPLCVDSVEKAKLCVYENIRSKVVTAPTTFSLGRNLVVRATHFLTAPDVIPSFRVLRNASWSLNLQGLLVFQQNPSGADIR